MKTLHQLLQELKRYDQEIETYQKQVAEVKDKIHTATNEIFENFRPKDLIGLECDIAVEPWSGKPTKSAYDSLMSDNVFLVNYYNGGYKKIMVGRKCKIKDIRLTGVYPDGSIVWRLQAAPANADGSYGKLHIYSNIIDKTHLAD